MLRRHWERTTSTNCGWNLWSRWIKCQHSCSTDWGDYKSNAISTNQAKSPLVFGYRGKTGRLREKQSTYEKKLSEKIRKPTHIVSRQESNAGHNGESKFWHHLANAVPLENSEFKIWRQQRRLTSKIWVVEWGKTIVLHKRRREILISGALRLNRARSGKSFILNLSVHENHSSQANESVYRLFYTTWPTWNNRKTLS